MEVILQKNPEAASALAAKIIAKLLQKKPDAVLGLASGDTPLRTYKNLVAMENRGEISFASCTFFSLDEYVGLGPTDSNSYRHYYESNFFSRLKQAPHKIHTPDGLTGDVELCCTHYEEEIRRAGGIDLQILGIGQDAHLAFNEPGSSLASRTRIKTLNESTLRTNQKHFSKKQKVPKHVLTMGLATILEAKHCVLLAFGPTKARAVHQMVEGPLSASAPASILQMHPKAQILLDLAAAKALKRKRYYQFVYDSKPAWQR